MTDQIATQNNLKAIREQMGISQRVLALACGQYASQIRKYEKGICMPSYKVLRSISKFLNVMIEELYPNVLEIDRQTERIKEILLGDSFSQNK